MNKNAALGILKEAKEILDTLGVKFFLSNGTALGYHRNGDFISHDQDIDLGVFIDDWDPNIIEAFVGAGYEAQASGSIDSGLEYSFRKGEKVDIFFYYRDEDWWHGIYFGDKSAKYIYKPFELEEVVFSGLRVLCPTKDYLNNEFGYDWIHPVKEWHWWYSPRNIRYE